MKEKTRIFRWNESRNKSVVVNGVFNPNELATCASIEMKRVKKFKLDRNKKKIIFNREIV